VEPDRQTYRVARWVAACFFAAAVPCAIAAYVSFEPASEPYLVLFLAGLALVWTVGAVDSLLTRLVLAPEEAEIVLYFSRIRLPRAEIADVVVGKRRRPVAFELRSGRKVKLPPTHGPELDTLHGWLRRTGGSSA
jgi:hypothetical protein